VEEIVSAILSGNATAEDFAGLRIPESYRGITLHSEEVDLFEGMASADRDPRKSVHLDDVPVPELGPGEALVAVMASSVNYNTVWSSIFEPIPTFAFLRRYGKQSDLAARHDLPYHVIGSDLAGVVLRTGAGVHLWKPGDEVVAHCLSVELESADGHNDTMLDPQQRIWGFETNFGGLAEIALVKSNQLMPKPAHLTWEESASLGLVNSTAYRQLISRNGAGMKQGDNVLIWGASGGLGSYATQLALAGGGMPVCVVSSPHKAAICEAMGATAIIDRSAQGYRFWKDEHHQDPKEWKRFGQHIRELTGGEDVDIVFEHPGRETFGASVYVTRKGGTIVTCASTSGYVHEYDNRYLWMSLKRIIGSHFANYREAWEANRLVTKAKIHPTLSRTYPLEETGQAAYDVHRNLHHGKVGVLALAPHDGLGVRDTALRDQHIGAINLFREDLSERTIGHSREDLSERTIGHSRDDLSERTIEHSRDGAPLPTGELGREGAPERVATHVGQGSLV
jgi:crotonyl-CoA reductase